MTKIKMIDLNGKEVREISLSERFSIAKPHQQAMFDQVIAENAGARQGTHSTLTKGEVRGGGRKPYKQKHTGNARQGSIRNPHWVGGGVVFGPKPTRNYKVGVNAKVSKLALVSALSLKTKDNMFIALDDKESPAVPSAKSFIKIIQLLNLGGKKILVITNDEGENAQKLAKSAGNIERVIAKKWNQVSVKDILHANCVIAQFETIQKLEKVVA